MVAYNVVWAIDFKSEVIFLHNDEIECLVFVSTIATCRTHTDRLRNLEQLFARPHAQIHHLRYMCIKEIFGPYLLSVISSKDFKPHIVSLLNIHPTVFQMLFF